MPQAIRFHRTGGPEVLTLETVEVGAPGPAEVRIAQHAIGINFADISLRNGSLPTALPACPGSEAAGIVEAVGADVTGLRPGDRVAYGGSLPGAYATARVVPAQVVTRLPDGIGFDTAAGMMSAGLTAGYLIESLWPTLQPGDTILFHAAAGGVGQIAVQWAKCNGLTVIGTVGSQAKVATARAVGCDHVLVTGEEDIAARVHEITQGRGVAVAYDSLGQATALASLASLRRRGLLVLFGAVSGPPPAIDARQLALQGSVFMTRPAFHDYLTDPSERARLTARLFERVTSGGIRIAVNARYPLADAAQAHRDIEMRRTTGSSILVVDRTAPLPNDQE